MNEETSTKKNVAKKESAGALQAVSFEQDAGLGVGKIGVEDLALPFLKILGQLSPEVNKRDGRYVEGAEAGMIYNSVTGELFEGEKGIEVIPAYYNLKYVEWRDRGTGVSAPVAIHDNASILSETTRGADYKDRLPSGNYIEKTANHFVIITETDVPQTALVAMKSTNLKISRKWNTMINQIRLKNAQGKLYNPASFSHFYRLRTAQQQNDKGTWFTWEVSKVGQLDPQKHAGLYNEAKRFCQSVSAGDVEVKYSTDEGGKSTDSIM